MANFSNLKPSDASFSNMMLENGFGIVTVMNAAVYDTSELLRNGVTFNDQAQNILTSIETSTKVKPLCILDTLKIANVTVEGPTKTVTGGQYSNPLIKFGKSARLEIQDALGNAKAIEALCGGVNEFTNAGHTTLYAMHYGEDFTGDKTIIGSTFFIDRATGKQVKVKIIFYKFNPDSIFNLTQDAEGDATVFDMNGDLLTTEILVGDNKGSDEGLVHGVFYSIIDEAENPEAPEEGLYFETSGGTTETPVLTLTAKTGYKVNGKSSETIAKDAALRVKVTTNTDPAVLVFDEVIKNY